MPRLGLDLSPLAGRLAGVGVYCRGLLEGLAEIEHGIEMCGYLATHRRIASAMALPPCRRLPLPPRGVHSLWAVLGAPRMDAFLGGADLIHATNYVLPPVRSAKRVLSIHDVAVLTHPEWCSPRIAQRFAQRLRDTAHWADAVLTPSAATAQAVCSLLPVDPQRVFVTPYGASPPQHAIQRESALDTLRAVGVAAPFFLFTGTLEPRKNIAGLLTAFARLPEDLPHRLVLAGAQGWGAATFAEPLQKLTRRNRAIHLGYVDASLQEALYAAADALVFPSWDEGFGLPVLEAMARGCPVIASKAGALPETVGDAGVLVDPADTAALAAAMRTLAEDDGRREALAGLGRRRARRFTWRKTAEASLAVYRSLL